MLFTEASLSTTSILCSLSLIFIISTSHVFYGKFPFFQYPVLIALRVDAVYIKHLPWRVEHDVHMVYRVAVRLESGAERYVHHLGYLLVDYQVFAQPGLWICIYREFPYPLEISLF